MKIKLSFIKRLISYLNIILILFLVPLILTVAFVFLFLVFNGTFAYSVTSIITNTTNITNKGVVVTTDIFWKIYGVFLFGFGLVWSFLNSET